MLSLRVKVEPINKVIYTIENVSLKNFCGDLHICSKIFGGLDVRSDLLRSGDKIVKVHEFTETPVDILEDAGVYIDGCLVSNRFVQSLPIGIAPLSSNVTLYDVSSLTTSIGIMVGNSQNATQVMKGATVKVKLFDLKNYLMSTSGEIVEDGILFRIPDLAPGKAWSEKTAFRIRYETLGSEVTAIFNEFLFQEHLFETWALQPVHIVRYNLV